MTEKTFDTVITALAEKLDERDVEKSQLYYDASRLKEKLEDAENTIKERDKTIEDKNNYIAKLVEERAQLRAELNRKEECDDA